MRSIELLAPARTADIGIEAIRHGADAVYIGPPAFGARAAAGNSVEDIARLVRFAHLYRAKVYATVNTLIHDHETTRALDLIHQLHDIGTDALIVQDLRLLSLPLPPIPLHASTQMDNRTPDKVRQLAALGFGQVVLARELTPSQVAAIHAECPDTRLEVFVHGALCVGLSGRCNASEALFGRSANRGECAQVCRMAFDLKEDGRTLVSGKHLLSLKDNCQLDHLDEWLDAGASSLKIEGRLKDAAYVKNVTAAYSQALDRIIERHPDRFRRTSSGSVRLSFTPDVTKSFNRGFVTDTSRPEANIHTPKAMGEPVSPHTVLHNGDGLCYLENGTLVGFRVNNAATFRPKPGVQYYRNQDTEWERILSKTSAERRIGVETDIYDDHATMTDEDGVSVTIPFPPLSQPARTPQTDNIRRQLEKLGDTTFVSTAVRVRLSGNYFIPSSTLSSLRRQLTSALEAARQPAHSPEFLSPPRFESGPRCRDNAITQLPSGNPQLPVMICHYCVRRQLGICLKEGAAPRPLTLSLANGASFRLEFDCRECLMKLYLP